MGVQRFHLVLNSNCNLVKRVKKGEGEVREAVKI